MIEENREILALLERGKARFVSERNLVKNWINYAETSDGTGLVNSEQLLMHKGDKDICRMCILGGVYVETDAKYIVNGSILGRAGELLKKTANTMFPRRDHYLTTSYTLTEVHRIYDKAIETVKGWS